MLTLHTAKGLEFPAVFMVGMEEGIFPHSRSFNDLEQMEEERRLAYVGITRAKDWLYLTRAFRRSTYGFEELTIPSSFLEDIPDELVDESNRRQRVTATTPSTGGRYGVTQPITQPVSTRWNQGGNVDSTPKTPGYTVGDQVYHDKFGEGTVISVELEGNEEYVQVAFPNQGIKKLSTSFAPLEKR
jgi:DNA helicase-2/ATP-dependent DNA helicase PcrA